MIPIHKVEQYGEVIAQSPKLMIMSDLLLGNNREWNDDLVIKHNNEMLEFLKSSEKTKTSVTARSFNENAVAEIRAKKGMTFEKAKELISGDKLTFGIMMVKAGDADGLVSGACHTSADMLRPALQIIKTAPGRKVASIAFIFELPTTEFGENGILLCADCALMQDPNPEELAEIGAESAASFEALVAPEARVAFLCHSTKGSAKHPFVDKVTSAVAIAKEKYPDVLLDGELQLDAAIIPEIGASKAPGSPVAGKANVLIFPNLEAGNIGYKLIQRIGKANAYSFLQGLAAPVNDLSRGCSVEEIVGVIAVTAVQAQQIKKA